MSAVAPAPAPPVQVRTPRRFDNGREWLDALGGVPMDRVIWNPWPGTATEADLLRLVERDRRLCELINNTLVEKAVGYMEERVVTRLSARMSVHAEGNDLGIVNGPAATMRVDSGNVRLPDVTFVTRQRAPTTWAAIPDLSPDLIVEVLSPSNTPREIAGKLAEFFAGGTRLAWVVDPRARTVAVYHGPGNADHVLKDGDTIDGEDVLPGFTLAVSFLLRDLPPT